MTLTASPPATITIRRPTAAPIPADAAPAFTADRPLAGLRVGIRTDGAWRSWQHISEIWSEWLMRDGAASVEVIQTNAMVGAEGGQDRSDVAAWAERIDVGISGLGTCGSCTSFTVKDAVAAEDAGKPVVAVVTTEFEAHGRNMANHLGHGNLKVLVLPYPLEARPDAELDAIATENYPAVLSLLGVQR